MFNTPRDKISFTFLQRLLEELVPVLYALITHGRNSDRMKTSDVQKLRPVRNLLEFKWQSLADKNATFSVEYCRKIKSTSSLPKLIHLLERAKQHGFVVITDDFRRIFSRCEREHRLELCQDLAVFEEHFIDLRTIESLSTMSRDLLNRVVWHEGPVTFTFKSNKPKTEPTPWGRNQVKGATKASAKVRALKADKKAEELGKIRTALTEDGKVPTLKAIADAANARGLKTTRNNDWTVSTVQRALKRLEQ